MKDTPLPLVVWAMMHVGRPVYGQADGTTTLFRLAPDGKTADRVRVRFGAGSANRIEILDGLEAGDAIILSDMAQWADHDRVRIR